jgi:hypothetical protein
MALPRPLYAFFENAQIPLLGIAVTSTIAAAGCFAASAVGLLDNSVANRLAAIGAISGVGAVTFAEINFRDASKRLEEMRQRHEELVADRLTRAALSGEVERDTSIPSSPEVRIEVSSKPIFVQPEACRGCDHYHGWAYEPQNEVEGVNLPKTQFICGMHPSGPIGDTCEDWEGIVVIHTYRIVRIQGGGSNSFYFAPTFSGIVWRSDLQNSIELDPDDDYDAEQIKALCRRYRLKHKNGLPGCEFKTTTRDTQKAFNELIESCPSD